MIVATGTSRNIYHTDPECHVLDRAGRTAVVDASSLSESRECAYCSGLAGLPKTADSTASFAHIDPDVLPILEEAEHERV